MVTTVLATYRRPALLARAIRSVLQQSYPARQVAVYDNASGDDTAQVVAGLARVDPRITYHCHPKNLGGPENYRYGLERVATKYFSFLADDDILLPRFYELAVAGLEAHPQAMYVVCQVLRVDPQGRVLMLEGHDWPPGVQEPPQAMLAMVERGHPTWTGIVFRRDVLDRVGTLDRTTGLSSDVDFELRIAAQCPILFEPQPGAISSCHSASASTVPRLANIWPAFDRVIRNITENDRIAEDVRTRALRAWNGRLAIRLFFLGMDAGSRGVYEDGYGAATVLRTHCRQTLAASVLWTAVVGCKYLPPIRMLLRGLIGLGRWVRRIRWRSIQATFEREHKSLLKL